MSDKRDQGLGMDRRIHRRDFLNGVAVTSSAVLAGALLASAAGEIGAADYAPEKAHDYYPPALTGMRGSGYPSAYAVGHELRDHTLPAAAPVETHEVYDMIVVGGGISGLSSAYYCRKFGGSGKRILVLDNHDDFGGHAKRNEFRADGQLRISNAGTFALYAGSPNTQALLTELGITISALARKNTNRRFYSDLGMGMGVFFDKETFGEDKLVLDPAPWSDFRYMYEPLTPPNQERRWELFREQAPLSATVKADLYRLYQDKRDYLPGSTTEQKIEYLKKISYKDFVLKVVGCDPMVATYLRDRTFGSARGLDAISALNGYNRGLPGFQGMNLGPEEDDNPDEVFHFPEGNATVARLLVRRLIPGALPGTTLEDSITTRLNYARLDEADSPVRIRLNSTVVKVQHSGKGVEVIYSRGAKRYRAEAHRCVLACWHMIIPYICPELPSWQKEALSYQVKAPNLWVNVWLRNWRPFKKAGVNLINSPTGYYSSITLEQPVRLGAYQHSQTSDDPIVLTMLHGYSRPGLPLKEQYRLGRAEMYGTSFETFERNARDQLARALGSFGFEPANDILGLTVNRWGHGYSYMYSELFDTFLAKGEEPPHLRARQRFGRITIANCDAAADDTTGEAIDQAFRAVTESLIDDPQGAYY